MKSSRWQLRLAGALAALAAVLYALRWLAFPGATLHNEMWRFLLGDIAFLFIQVPLVTLLIDRVIQQRQRDEMLNKLNMVIGAFFSEAGRSLLGDLAKSDRALVDVQQALVPSAQWKSGDYRQATDEFMAHKPAIDLALADLPALRASLADERSFLIGLLSNQSLLEHETFTDLLWALTHLGEELEVRGDLSALSPSDARHIEGDIARAYRLLGREWLAYLRHLQLQYPFLFSLALRMNPLDPDARPEVT